MNLPGPTYCTDEDGAAYIAGEQAALLIRVPAEDRGRERAFWTGFLSTLRRRGDIQQALLTGAPALDLHQLGGAADGR